MCVSVAVANYACGKGVAVEQKALRGEEEICVCKEQRQAELGSTGEESYQKHSGQRTRGE